MLKSMRTKISQILTMSKKGQIFENISGLLTGVLALAIVAVVVFVILANLSTNAQVTTSANATRAIQALSNSAQDAVGFVPLIVLAAVGSILLGLVGLFVVNRMR